VAELLNVSTSAYQRMEKNETQADFEFMQRAAEKLGVSVLEFLPDVFSVYNNQQTGQGGIVLSNYSYYANADETSKGLAHEVELLKAENKHLKEKMALLERQIELLDKK
jgi:transcriptional regulator with XRE-family HTH domain